MEGGRCENSMDADDGWEQRQRVNLEEFTSAILMAFSVQMFTGKVNLLPQGCPVRLKGESILSSLSVKSNST